MGIVICDDDAKACERYEQILLEIIEKNHIPAIDFEIYESGIRLLESWQWEEHDILFLDIMMPEKNGVEVATELRERGYKGEIIFLTASKDYVLAAFDVEAFHYLVKTEVDRQKIERVFLNAYEESIERKRRHITLSCGGDICNISLDSIYYFELKNRIITVYYGNKESFAFYSTMGKLEKTFGDEGFIRIHRAYVVATNKIKVITKRNTIQLLDGTEIPVGNKYLKNLQRE